MSAVPAAKTPVPEGVLVKEVAAIVSVPEARVRVTADDGNVIAKVETRLPVTVY